MQGGCVDDAKAAACIRHLCTVWFKIGLKRLPALVVCYVPSQDRLAMVQCLLFYMYYGLR